MKDVDSKSEVLRSYPGWRLYQEFLKPLKINRKELAFYLKVNVNRIEQVIRGTSPITPDTALRIGKFFETSPKSWLYEQARFSLSSQFEIVVPQISSLYEFPSDFPQLETYLQEKLFLEREKTLKDIKRESLLSNTTLANLIYGFESVRVDKIAILLKQYETLDPKTVVLGYVSHKISRTELDTSNIPKRIEVIEVGLSFEEAVLKRNAPKPKRKRGRPRKKEN